MDVLWKLQPSTAAKHRLYQRYLGAWWPKLLQPGTNGWRRSRVTYIDAFAGPGVYEDGDEGSPVFVLRQLLEHRAAEAMNLTPERVRLVFVERERTRVDRLRLELHERFGPIDRLPGPRRGTPR